MFLCASFGPPLSFLWYKLFTDILVYSTEFTINSSWAVMLEQYRMKESLVAIVKKMFYIIASILFKKEVAVLAVTI